MVGGMKGREFYHQIGRRIRHHRQKAGLNQADLAKRLECSPSLISKWEIATDATLPSISILDVYRLAVVLSIPPAELLPNPNKVWPA